MRKSGGRAAEAVVVGSNRHWVSRYRIRPLCFRIHSCRAAHNLKRPACYHFWVVGSSLKRNKLGGFSMGSYFRIAAALVRIPHLALSLFFFPLVMSLGLVFLQLIVTGIILKQVNTTSEGLAAVVERKGDRNAIRWVLYGSGDRRAEPMVCRWVSDRGRESPPSADCNPDRLDLAVRVQDAATSDVSSYVDLFRGHVDRVHVCQSCQPDVVIEPRQGGKTISQARSIFGLMLLFLPYTNSEIEQSRVVVRRSIEEVKTRLGEVSLTIPEIDDTIGITALKGTLPIVFNVSFLVVIALWLALRAHRRVLDYFSRNDVLLPLAAACGRQQFYSAIWLLTALRVGCFLITSVPIVYLGLRDVIDEDALRAVKVSPEAAVMWVVALIATMALATVIGSISELKHRHSFVSFLYKVVPFAAAVLGAALWGLSFVLPSEAMGMARLVVSALPIVGIAPVLVAPATSLPVASLAVHALLATVAFFFILRRNARWFAAHLEEV